MMVEIEIDGKKVQAEENQPLLQVALDAGVSIPHFCYHKKLSITASCRMCLVEVEKAPRLMPACATPVQNGMVVHTDTQAVKDARKSVMEFLLLNHPLDCPICDQGGECRLQDYAMHYGDNQSRYTGEKRIVLQKQTGPLLSMQEMQRCIHCTRCIRFLSEIAGEQQLGMFARGENAHVASLFEDGFEHELSGNLIDICPVGAITSKPYRYTARGWELTTYRGISPHDGLGSNLSVQTLRGKVMRVLPAENPDINDCWLSDRDRFSYEALNSEERLQVPMIKQNNEWIETDWQTALSYVVHGLTHISAEHGAQSIAALASAQATLEEMLLLKQLMQGIGSDKIEARLHHVDASLNDKLVPWLGMPIAEIEALESALVIGANLRDEAPLLMTRFRAGVAKGMHLSVIDPVNHDWAMPLLEHVVLSPSLWLDKLYEIMAAIAKVTGATLPVDFSQLKISESAHRIAQSLLNGAKKAIFLGASVLSHATANRFHASMQWICEQTGATLGYLTTGANTTAAWMAKIYPQDGETTLADIASWSTKAFMLLHTEPALDCHYAPQMMRALKNAEMVVVMSPFKQNLEEADVLLPVAAFTETAGTFINMAGQCQSFEGISTPPGQTRPAWKVLRVLGNFLQLPGFDANSAFDVRDAWLEAHTPSALLNNKLETHPTFLIAEKPKFVRVACQKAPWSDLVARHAKALSQTKSATAPMVRVSPTHFEELGVAAGDIVRVTQAYGSVQLSIMCDEAVPEGVVRLDEGHPSTAVVGPVDGWIKVERI